MGRLATAVALVAMCLCAALALSRWGRHATAATAAHRVSRPASRPVRPAARATAERAYAVMRSRFADKRGLYRDLERPEAHVWPVSQALAASLELAQLPGRRGEAARADALRTFRSLSHYRLGRAYAAAIEPPSGSVRFYDDNEWLAQDLLLGYRLFGRRALLVRAESMFRFLVSGWDTDVRHSCVGGVFWADTPAIRDRNTVSTANAALVALGLYQATRQHSYLVWATRMYAWVSRCLAAPTGLYFDHLDRGGKVETSEWTYNQGAMVAAGALLAEATGQRRYLEQAKSLARKALGHYRATGYAGEPPIFVAIFFRDLRVLADVRPGTRYSAELRDYIRRHAVPKSDDSFGRTLLDRAAAAQLYSFAAAD